MHAEDRTTEDSKSEIEMHVTNYEKRARDPDEIPVQLVENHLWPIKLHRYWRP